MAEFRLVINGQRRSVTAEPDVPLLWVLREQLGLTGTKYGCGIARCGACIVHLDGEPVPSCVVTVESAASRRITTIEGLSVDRAHPIQQAWIELNVPQCGYCQSGQIMAAAALLERVPQPSDSEIDTALSPVLCRCGVYSRIREAVHRAAGLLSRSRDSDVVSEP